jgi:hypothetical protein
VRGSKRRDDLRQDEWRHPAFKPHSKRLETQFQRRMRVKREQAEQLDKLEVALGLAPEKPVVPKPVTPAPALPTVRVLRSVPLSSPAPSCLVCSDRPDNRDPAGCRGCARPFGVAQ